MLKLSPRSGCLAAALTVLAMSLSAPGAASARSKKKHPKHAPAHHTKHPGKQPATEESAEPATSGESAESPGESASAHHEGDHPKNHEEGEASDQNDKREDSASEASGESAPRRPPASRPHAESESEDESSSTTGTRSPPALRGGVGFGSVYRHLTWTSPHAGLSNYAMNPGPELGGWLEVYPGAFVDRGFAANIGAILSFNRGFGVSSKSGAGVPSDAIFEDFVLGLKMRFPLGFFVPHVSAAYAGQAFLFSPRIPEVPSVFYKFVRLAAGLRAQIADAVDAEVEAAYLAVINSGDQAGYIGAPEYFPGLGAYGLEASGSVGVRVTGVFGLRAGVDFRQYALDLSHATGMLTVDKATDRYLTIWGGIEIVLDGAGNGNAGSAPSANKPPAPPSEPAGD